MTQATEEALSIDDVKEGVHNFLKSFKVNLDDLTKPAYKQAEKVAIAADSTPEFFLNDLIGVCSMFKVKVKKGNVSKLILDFVQIDEDGWSIAFDIEKNLPMKVSEKPDSIYAIVYREQMGYRSELVIDLTNKRKYGMTLGVSQDISIIRRAAKRARSFMDKLIQM